MVLSYDTDVAEQPLTTELVHVTSHVALDILKG
jgi:hypothetical protein